MKFMRKALSLLLSLVTAFSLVCFTASASSSSAAVIYDVRTKEFSFENADIFVHKEEDAHDHPQNVDLFRDMKDVYPGDVYAETIQIEVKNISGHKVYLHMHGENPNEDFEKLMGAGSEEAPILWVQFGDEVYNGALAEGVSLGEFGRFRKEDEITVTLEIPLEAGNKLQGLIAEIDWVFTAEVIPPTGGGDDDPEEIPDDPIPTTPPEEPPVIIPEPPVPTTPPKTGDASMLWLALAALSGAGLVFLLMTGKKKEEEA